MKIEQIYTGCIAHAAYYIESDGECAIFDPLRDVQPYLDRANKDQAAIKYVFETHFHADFVSGHLDLMEKTAAKIVFGPTAAPHYAAIIAEDGQFFNLGKIRIQLLHTPGHTMESSTYLIWDEVDKEVAIITGDTLFIGDVGRPDLVQYVNSDITAAFLAKKLFHSLRDKIMTLPDDIIVYPNHGAGSACGKNMSKETIDTLGNQKRTNYALRPDMTEDEFVEEVLKGLTAPPQYFPKNVLMNIQGYELLDDVLGKAKQPFSVFEFKKVTADSEVLILDTRDADVFAKGYIPNSINIGLNGGFAVWVGEMISDLNQKIILVTEPGKEVESLIRLSRVGYDKAIGFLENGFQAWTAAGLKSDTMERIKTNVFDETVVYSDTILLDVRKKSEYESEHLLLSAAIPLNELESQLKELSKEVCYLIYCAGGYRSMIAASLLKKNGFTRVADVIGGYQAIKKVTQLERSNYVCPTSLL
ncbi:rhodanese-like domain-containing protein [Flavobacterium sp. NKUCC04_CG]|uniref:MBL fold metallo-hydrolase n=1 Tax=Flavobacterium sp. NKUCC04_CG TaxID=2842121 RepID=UPI001C5B1907|nr:MBL fold metallo-hydrolase [Flavobacterium sp. NKUCC04_CG]MBW3519125.1 MBL fold metallo-hydrolase [Flavobacterium sp. NKUCC04_CG]